MGNTGAKSPPFPFAGLASRAPVLKSIFVTEPIPEGGSGKYVSEPVALKVCPERVAVQVIVYVDSCAERDERLKGNACLVLFRGTLPLVSVFPLTVTVTSRLGEPEGTVTGTAFAIFRSVTGVSMRMDTAVESLPLFASPGRNGRMDCAQRSARSGEVDVPGTGNSPPTIAVR